MIYLIILLTFYLTIKILKTQFSSKLYTYVFFLLIFLYFFTFSSMLITLALYSVIKYLYFHIHNRRNKTKIEAQSINFLDSFSNNLKAGLSREQAFLNTLKNLDQPIREEFKQLEVGLNQGECFSTLLNNTSQKTPYKFLKQFLISISISLEMGQGLSDQVEKLLENIRSTQNIKAKLSILSTQSQMQAYVCIALPLLFTFILYMIAPDFLWPLFNTSLGYLTLIVSFSLLCLGGYWILSIANKDYIG